MPDKKLKNPDGGLTAAGRAFYKRTEGANLKPGVKNYSDASPADKKRWVAWAFRFAGRSDIPPLRKPNGEPTRFALMFSAWGEPVPRSVEAVRKVHKKAISRREQLGTGKEISEHGSTLAYDALLSIVEAAFFDETKHPRWPKKSPLGKGGRWIGLGELINLDGELWEVAHVFGAEVVLHNASGKYGAVETKVIKATTGTDGEMHLKGATPAEPRAIKGGKTDSDVTIVDPYVDASTHDASILIPDNSAITAEEWLTFGKLDQQNYVDLQGKFGAHDPQKSPKLRDKAYAAYSSSVQNIVKEAFSTQYGGSSGYTLSLTNFIQHIKDKFTKADEKLWGDREQARFLQAEQAAIVQWDLYNRVHGADISLFHKSGGKGGELTAKQFYTQMIKGSKPMFSGLSQSWMYRKDFFGKHGVATPMAIRHILMSTYSVSAVNNSFSGEREVATQHQFAIDERSIAFDTTESLTPGASVQNWLEKVTSSPRNGNLIRDVRQSISDGSNLPIPPEPPDIEMGGSQVPAPVPAHDAPSVVQSFAEFLPEGKFDPTKASAKLMEIPWAHLDENGKPEATVAVESGLKAGDFMIGLQGTLYWVGPDPSDTSGFNLRYYKIEADSKGQLAYNGESYHFEGGGTNKYYALNLHADPPAIKETGDDVFDHGKYLNGTEETYLKTFAIGDKFKVNGNAYEVIGPVSGDKMPIMSLETDSKGTINAGYKSTKLMPKAGYVAILEELKLVPGVRFGSEGVEWVVTSVRKDGEIRAKPVKGGKVKGFAPEFDEQQLKDGWRFRPSDWIVEKSQTNGADLAKGDIIQSGSGTKYLRPLEVTKVSSLNVFWRELDGTTGKTKRTNAFRRLVPDVPESDLPESSTSPQSTTVPDNGHDPSDWVQDSSISTDEFVIGMHLTITSSASGETYTGTVVKDVGDAVGFKVDDQPNDDNLFLIYKDDIPSVEYLGMSTKLPEISVDQSKENYLDALPVGTSISAYETEAVKLEDGNWEIAQGLTGVQTVSSGFLSTYPDNDASKYQSWAMWNEEGLVVEAPEPKESTALTTWAHLTDFNEDGWTPSETLPMAELAPGDVFDGYVGDLATSNVFQVIKASDVQFFPHDNMVGEVANDLTAVGGSGFFKFAVALKTDASHTEGHAYMLSGSQEVNQLKQTEPDSATDTAISFEMAMKMTGTKLTFEVPFDGKAITFDGVIAGTIEKGYFDTYPDGALKVVSDDSNAEPLNDLFLGHLGDTDSPTGYYLEPYNIASITQLKSTKPAGAVTLDTLSVGQKYVSALPNGTNEQREVMSVSVLDGKIESYKVKVLTGENAGHTLDVPAAFASNIAVTPLKAKVDGDHKFDVNKFKSIDPQPITDFKAGELFLSAKGVPYKVGKDWNGKSKHVQAVNLDTGKPYPVPVAKSMRPLVAKAGLVDVAPEGGDTAFVSNLSVGDVFQLHGAEYQKVWDGGTNKGVDGIWAAPVETKDDIGMIVAHSDKAVWVPADTSVLLLSEDVATTDIADVVTVSIDGPPPNNYKSLEVGQHVEASLDGIATNGVLAKWAPLGYVEIKFTDGTTKAVLYTDVVPASDLPVGALAYGSQLIFGDVVEGVAASGVGFSGVVTDPNGVTKDISPDFDKNMAHHILVVDESGSPIYLSANSKVTITGKTTQELTAPTALPLDGKDAWEVVTSAPVGAVMEGELGYGSSLNTRAIKTADEKVLANGLTLPPTWEFYSFDDENGWELNPDLTEVPLADFFYSKDAGEGVTISYPVGADRSTFAMPVFGDIIYADPETMKQLPVGTRLEQASGSTPTTWEKIGGNPAGSAGVILWWNELNDETLSSDQLGEKQTSTSTFADGFPNVTNGDPSGPMPFTVLEIPDKNVPKPVGDSVDALFSPELTVEQAKPYKSSYGAGGKVKYLRVDEMKAGTVFKGKGGAKAPMWVVVNPETRVVSPLVDDTQMFVVPEWMGDAVLDSHSPVRWKVVEGVSAT
jgi:Domain of unknown function (DUF6321)